MAKQKKPYRGRLDLWRRCVYSNGIVYWGMFCGHPDFHGKFGHTSKIIRESPGNIETLNSRYSLGDPAPEVKVLQ